VLLLGAAAVATLGSWLQLRSHRLLPLPWIVVRDLPVFDNVIPLRFSLYVALAASVAVALWAATSRRSRLLRAGLVIAAALAIFPNLALDVWRATPPRPAFFAAGLYRDCLAPGATALLLPPPNRTAAMLWQAESGFAFRMANGNLSPVVPDGVPLRGIAAAVNDDDVPGGGKDDLLRLARAQGVDAILVDAGAAKWRALLGPAPVVGGVAVYALRPGPTSCRRAGRPRRRARAR
jgi:hypothetical protein